MSERKNEEDQNKAETKKRTEEKDMEKTPTRKIGAGHAAAMLRLGLKELRNALNPSRESVADSEIGLYGSQTRGEIAQARSGPGEGPEQEQKLSLAGMRSQAKEAEQGQEPNRGQPAKGRDDNEQ